VATRAQVIDKVRRRVFDFDPPIVITDVYYEDALDFALGKLCLDLGLTFANVPAVTDQYLFLLIKLATIEICFVRASNVANATEAGEGLPADLTSITVPDLTVMGTSAGVQSNQGSAFWMKLANELQSEYDGEAQTAGPGTFGGIEVGHLHRQSLTIGGIARRLIDPGPPVTSVVATVVGSDVTFDWSILYYDYFSRYEVIRSTLVTMVDPEIRKQEVDNQVATWTDESVTSGTWYYAIRTVNLNELKNIGAVATVVVP